MKNTLLFMLLLMATLFVTSCAKEELKTEHQESIMKRYSESYPDCCDHDIQYEVIDSDDNCCTYKVTFTNTSFCTQRVVGIRGGMIDVAPGETGSIRVKVCNNDPNNPNGIKTIKIYTGTKTSVLCEEIELPFDCSSVMTDCCGDITYSTQHNGGTNGCCKYIVTVSNQSDCDMFLFSQFGTNGAIAQNSTMQFHLEVCENGGTQTTSFYVGPTISIADACDTFELMAGDCKI